MKLRKNIPLGPNVYQNMEEKIISTPTRKEYKEGEKGDDEVRAEAA